MYFEGVGFRGWGLGCQSSGDSWARIQGLAGRSGREILGFGVQGLGLMVPGPRGMAGLGSGVWGLGFEGLEIRVTRVRCAVFREVDRLIVPETSHGMHAAAQERLAHSARAEWLTALTIEPHPWRAGSLRLAVRQ